MHFPILDDPAILTRVFRPYSVFPGNLDDNVYDGTLVVEDNIVLGFRLYAHQPNRAVIVYFHGNSEVAADYDLIALYFHRLAGVSLLVVDYRGYGWSTGKPSFSALLSDTEIVYRGLSAILERAELQNSPRYVMGRSLGSAPAIHLAYAHPDTFHGLILESGFADVPSLLRQLGVSQALVDKTTDELGNVRKLTELKLPLLVIHGEQDTLLPIAHGERLYQASAGIPKLMVRIPGAGHNNLLSTGSNRYFAAIKDFVNGTLN